MTSGGAGRSARERALAAFESEHGEPASAVARGPGRVNLIGEHTDYNEGFVLPLALGQAAYVAVRPRDDEVVELLTLDLGQRGAFRLSEVRSPDRRGDARLAQGGWLEYAKAVVWALQADGHTLGGLDGVIASDVPRGAGLSSSAALELALAWALLYTGVQSGRRGTPAMGSGAATGLSAPDAPPVRAAGPSPARLARAMQRAENEWIGVSSGIMDQLVGAAAVAGHALLIDCRDLSTTPVPLPPEASVVVLDTATRRRLAGSAFNERRAACQRVAAAFGVASLRDLDAADLAHAAAPAGLSPTDLARARHVVAENQRTLAAARLLAEGDAVAVGKLMDQSHASLRDLYEVSSTELDAMVTAARAAPGCLGARMTGAGFGGCAVALVERGAETDFAASAATAYRQATGLVPALYPAVSGGAAGVVEHPSGDPALSRTCR